MSWHICLALKTGKKVVIKCCNLLWWSSLRAHPPRSFMKTCKGDITNPLTVTLTVTDHRLDLHNRCSINQHARSSHHLHFAMAKMRDTERLGREEKTEGRMEGKRKRSKDYRDAISSWCFTCNSPAGFSVSVVIWSWNDSEGFGHEVKIWSKYEIWITRWVCQRTQNTEKMHTSIRSCLAKTSNESN